MSTFISSMSEHETPYPLVYATTIHIVRRRDRACDVRLTSEWPEPMLCHSVAPPIDIYYLLLAICKSLTGLHKSHESHLRTTSHQPELMMRSFLTHARLLTHSGKARMIAALVGFLSRSTCRKCPVEKTRHHCKDDLGVRHALQKHPETIPAHET